MDRNSAPGDSRASEREVRQGPFTWTEQANGMLGAPGGPSDPSSSRSWTSLARTVPSREENIEKAILLMRSFADRTGLTSGRPKARYLWTDAFAVCNFLEL